MTDPVDARLLAGRRSVRGAARAGTEASVSAAQPPEEPSSFAEQLCGQDSHVVESIPVAEFPQRIVDPAHDELCRWQTGGKT